MSQAVLRIQDRKQRRHIQQKTGGYTHTRTTGGTLEAKAVIVQVFAKHDRSWQRDYVYGAPRRSSGISSFVAVKTQASYSPTLGDKHTNKTPK